MWKKWSLAAVCSFGILGFGSAVDAASFKDVRDDTPLAPVVDELSDYGIVSGYPDGTFRPNGQMERQHVAALLTRAVPLETKRKQGYFKDVLVTHRNFSDILALQRAGIIDGTSDGRFQPTAPITRAQMAKMLTEAFDLKNDGKRHPFKDVAKSHWADGAISALYANEIAYGNSHGNFQPNGIVTRGEYALFLHRALERAGGGTVKRPTHAVPAKVKPFEEKNDRMYLHGMTLGSDKRHVTHYLGEPKRIDRRSVGTGNGQTIEEIAEYGLYTIVFLNDRVDTIMTNYRKDWVRNEAAPLHRGPVYEANDGSMYFLRNTRGDQLLVAKNSPTEVFLGHVDDTFLYYVNDGTYKKIR
ncbi:MAG TPA: S-layer homology domain-containing protein [Savagea sp.]